MRTKNNRENTTMIQVKDTKQSTVKNSRKDNVYAVQCHTTHKDRKYKKQAQYIEEPNINQVENKGLSIFNSGYLGWANMGEVRTKFHDF